MAKNEINIVSGWAFLIGVILAVLLGFYTAFSKTDLGVAWTYVLFVVGLIVGFLNVTDKESGSFLMAGVVLIIASEFGQSSLGVISVLGVVFNNLMMIFVPATIIVAIKHAFGLAKG